MMISFFLCIIGCAKCWSAEQIRNRFFIIRFFKTDLLILKPKFYRFRNIVL